MGETGHSFSGLFVDAGGGGRLAREAAEPDYFDDLQLDQLVETIVAGSGAPGLEAAYRSRLVDPRAVERRQAVVADLEDSTLRDAARAFCAGLARSAKQWELALRDPHPQRSQRWHLDAVTTYVDTVEEVASALAAASPRSAGLREWAAWLLAHRAGPAFRALADRASGLVGELSGLHYTLTISGDRVTVSPFDGQVALGAETVRVFDRFRVDGDVPPVRDETEPGDDSSEAHTAILGLVVQLFPDVFDRLAAFTRTHEEFRDPVIDEVERELRFVLSWWDFSEPLRRAGLPWCRPSLRPGRGLDATATYDVLLARDLIADGRMPVTNDVALRDEESVLVVTGPNQGGKTTFARTMGQLHHLAALGLAVPGRAVSLHLPDLIATHVDRGDRVEDLRSRLESEVLAVRALLERIGPDSLVILNEMFSSTTAVDALALSSHVLSSVLDVGATCVCVTFVDELSVLDPRVVSLVAGTDEHETSRRTFSVTRAPADGKAHALALAASHGLTRGQLIARIGGRP